MTRKLFLIHWSIALFTVFTWGQNMEKEAESSARLLQEAKPIEKESPAKKEAQKVAAPEEEVVNPYEEYRTPRAGKALKGSLLGIDIEVPARERDKVTAISIGAELYTPRIGDSNVVPFAAFYYADTWEEKTRRLRAVVAVFANFINFYEGSWNKYGFELAFNFENYTLPVPSTLAIEDKELEGSEVYWGYVRGGVGLGWYTRLPPYEFDSYLSIYCFYEPGVLYFDDTDATAQNYIVPPTTYEERLHVMLRYDAMERNIMELRHEGWAGGADFVWAHRYKWKDHDFNGSFSEDDTQRYLLFTGYACWAGGPKFLSERHRFMISAHGGFSPGKRLDRYSAPKLGGGPGGDESEALSRSPIPGAKFDEYIVSRYLLFTLEYRFELLFFLYLHIKGVIGPVRRMELAKDKTEVDFTKDEAVGSLGAAITTGFVWDSQLYVEYVHDWGILRGKDKAVDSILITWSKSF